MLRPIYVVWPEDVNADDRIFQTTLELSLNVIAKMTERQVRVVMPEDVMYGEIAARLP